MTIYAISTPPGKSAIAVIRISGAAASAALRALTHGALPKARQAALRILYHPATHAAIDSALVLRFDAPNSFTGEDMIELQTHGSRAVLQLMLEALAAIPELRPAEPGEFSRRAFLNGKMDLTEAEGLADLIDAETRQQQQLAMRQMQGELHILYEGWRWQLVQIMACLEAYIDFPDEPLPDTLEAQIMQVAGQLLLQMQLHLNDNLRGQRLREGALIVILGAPNAGKSSFLNYISRKEVAIVSPLAGTTRDALEVHLDIGGFPVTLVDTAGLRQSTDQIEQEGVRRSYQKAGDAELVLALIDGETYPDIPTEIAPYKDKAIIIMTKSDLYPLKTKADSNAFFISSVTGEGIATLMEHLKNRLAELMLPGNMPTITRTRHRQQIEQAAAGLSEFLKFGNNRPIELRAENMRHTAQKIGTLTGKIDLEEVLDALFSTFCIGK